MELWDAYDEHMNKLHMSPLIRGERIPDGVFHLVCGIAVKHIDGSYLIMQRDPGKHLGGMWEASAGGSALRGESPAECAGRELYEETGVLSDALEQLGVEVNTDHQTVYYEYICITNIRKTDIKLQHGETVAYKWISLDELLAMSKNELATTRILKYLQRYNRVP